ncbi:MAG: M23 family metallopeptidase, partial [Pseudomonadota bacterium]
LKITAKLGPVPASYQDVIPPFNPYNLFADTNPIGPSTTRRQPIRRDDVEIKVVELLGGLLPNEDGQTLQTNEVVDLINQTRQEDFLSRSLSATGEAGFEVAGLGQDGVGSETRLDPNTTAIEKSIIESDDEMVDYPDARKVILKAGDGDNLRDLLLRQGSDAWVVDSLIEAIERIRPDQTLTFGQEVHITLVPSLNEPNTNEPARLSIYGFGHNHLVTVERDAAGDFKASSDPMAGRKLNASQNATLTKANSLYASVYYAGLLQNLAPAQIMQILKIHAYDTDFRRRIRPGDNVVFFFTHSEADLNDGPPGELLFTQINSGGETSTFYRFRADNGEWDFFSDDGNNSRRFLMRKPVRGTDVRLTSGFGMRMHPLLNRRRMHNGVDWAARSGTPILAAGKGTITYAGRKGANGNYVRIRHANGYQTSYSHMRRFAPGVKTGVRVRQGQVIGYVGSTGLSSGPHLHFEVLVNKRPTNPMKMKVGKERQLDGHDLRSFKAERARVLELKRRTPVMTSSR